MEHTFIHEVSSINFEPPDIDLCFACHVYPLFRGAWIVSILSGRIKKRAAHSEKGMSSQTIISIIFTNLGPFGANSGITFG